MQHLRESWGTEMEKVKLTYEAEMGQQRRVLHDTEDTRAQLEVRLAALEEQLSEAHQSYYCAIFSIFTIYSFVFI